MKRRIAGFIAALSLFGTVAAPAAAYDQAQARVAATTWINQHCGEVDYSCQWFVLNSLVSTGINETGHAQWKFGGQGAMTRKPNTNPFLPKYMSCTFGGGVGPEGGILNAFKVCSPEA